jgi:ADP-ribose pyrophosphatase YjhB (NUDIX family)
MKDHSFHTVFNHCPACGSERFVVNDEKSKRCFDCGFVYYFNVSAAVAAFITNERGELLVCRRKKDPAKGTLDLPGGFVDGSETAEEAVLREIKEESNLDVLAAVYLFSIPNVYRYAELDICTLDLFFEVKTDGFSFMEADDDVEEIYFISPQRLHAGDFGFVSIQEAVRRWLQRN